jgi:thiamine biosynthesis lipoprotein
LAKPKYLSIALLALLLCILPACSAAEKASIITISGQTMGTMYRIRLVSNKLRSRADLSHVSNSTLTLLEDFNHQMNHYDPNSTLSKFNALQNGSIQIKDEFRNCLLSAQQIYQESHGAFDITIAPLLKLWGYGPNSQELTSIPNQAALLAAKHNVGSTMAYELVGNQLTKLQASASIDLSAIAKGYAVDLVVQNLKKLGFDRFLVEIGGEIRASGTNIQNKPWSVAIIHPDSEINRYYATVDLSDESMATSGNYLTQTEIDGMTYSHTIDPRSGYPIQNNIASVTVISEDCVVADAMATAIGVLGVNAGLAWVESKSKIEAMILEREISGLLIEHHSSGFKRTS